MRRSIVVLAFAWISLVGRACFGQISFAADLTGAQEVPANVSPGTGHGTVVLNAAQNQITVDESWSGIAGPATASHIHGPAAPGVTAPVLFPFASVPAAISGSIPEQSFAISPTQVAQLEAGLFYFNVHSSTFPGGEIRGQITQVPEPASAGILLVLAAALVLLRRPSQAPQQA